VFKLAGRLTFEVASIKPSDPDRRGVVKGPRDPDRLPLMRATL